MLERQSDTRFPAGTKFRYSNSGYVTLAMIVEKVSGMSFAGFLSRNIFRPAGMRHTVAHREGLDTIANRAFGYQKDGQSFVRRDQSLASALLGDGGIYSSVDDMVRWDRALARRRLVSATAWAQATASGRLSDGRPTGYGYGWFLGTHKGRRIESHGGATVGFSTFIARFPDHHLTVIVLLNRNGENPEKLGLAMADLFLDVPMAGDK
jgi:CubicO group peptidase (beta-lactamase class C family)